MAVRRWTPPSVSWSSRSQAGVDELVDGIVARIRDEPSDFRRLPTSTLARSVRGTVSRALAALAELRPPTAAELRPRRGLDRPTSNSRPFR